MPLTGDAKKSWDRNDKRTKRYGNWRQIFYDGWGQCKKCGRTDSLDIHEEGYGDGVTVKSWELLCYSCHVGDRHNYTSWVRRKYASHLYEDVSAELTKYGLEGWKTKYHIVDKTDETRIFWEALVRGQQDSN